MNIADKSVIDRTRSASYQRYLREMMNKMRQDAEKSNSPSSSAAQAAFQSERSSEILEVLFYEKENAGNHHTHKYSLVHNPNGSLVIRRGQPFKMAIKLRGDYNPAEEQVTLEFSFGHEPNSNKGSQVHLDLNDQNTFSRLPAQWDVKIDSIEGSMVKLQVQVPPTIGIGVWTLSVNMSPKTAAPVTQVAPAAVKKYKCDKNIYILFNPWCKEDTVYMEKEDAKDEYIMNDVGTLYFGTYIHYDARPWVYGQFDVASLPGSMYLLDLSGLLYNERSNPVRVARAISNMMNKANNIPGDHGVLVGKWATDADEYKDGTVPWSWTGSAPILEKFLRTNGTPVRYAQCWVFAGVTTSVCRAVGIPSRTITCFAAGHDADETLTIDINYDSAGNRLTTNNTQDSIWNFHVWNEVWMTRLDLPAGYGGWQVIDGTPQEISSAGGGYQLGPCSVVGVKRGQVGLLYDTLFVFSEVNADLVNWALRDDNKGADKLAVNTEYIGQLVITKKIGNYDEKDAEDITDCYKYKEGTPEERMAVLNAARNAGKSQLFDMPDPSKEEIGFHLSPVKNVMVGEDFQMVLSIENRGRDRRTVMVVISCCSVHYTGTTASKIKEERKKILVPPSQKIEKDTTWTVKGSDYVDSLVEFGMIKMYCMCTVADTNQAWAGEQDFVLNKPKLQLELPNQLKVRQSYTLKVTFKNPYKKTLTECQFNAEGPGLIAHTLRVVGEIQGKEKVVREFPITPYYKGQTAVVAVFSSKELSEITGSKQVKVIK